MEGPKHTERREKTERKETVLTQDPNHNRQRVEEGGTERREGWRGRKSWRCIQKQRQVEKGMDESAKVAGGGEEAGGGVWGEGWRDRTGVNEHQGSNSPAVQYLFRMTAYKRSDVSSCDLWGRGRKVE